MEPLGSGGNLPDVFGVAFDEWCATHGYYGRFDVVQERHAGREGIVFTATVELIKTT